MKISKLIEKLRQIEECNGDVDVFCYCEDCCEQHEATDTIIDSDDGCDLAVIL